MTSEQKIVMICGPDMTGKTQIAQELSRRTGLPYFKATSEHTSFLSSRVSKNDQFLNQLRFADPRVLDLLRQTGHSVIFDRAYPCEYSYSKVLGRETDMKMLHHVDEEWANIGARVVLCHRSSYVGIEDDLDPTINAEVLQKLHDEYFTFASWTKTKLLKLNVDDEDLEREMREVLAFIKGL